MGARNPYPCHLSGAPLIKARTGARIGIGEHVREVQNIFRPIFGAEDVKAEGGDFDRLFKDGDRLDVGGLAIEVMHTPGHTPACVSYRIGSAVFVGDTLFMPDYGTARTDFPNAAESYAIIDGSWKLIHNVVRAPERAEFELFDFEKDPFDQKNVAADHPDVVERLGKLVDGFSRMAKAARLKPDSEAARTMSREQLEQLRSLGYVK